MKAISVNANKRHWHRAGESLARADRSWMVKLITRRIRPEDFEQALERKPDDIRVVVQLSEIRWCIQTARSRKK